MTLNFTEREDCFDSKTQLYNCPKNDCQIKVQTNRSLYDHLRRCHKREDILCKFSNCNQFFKTQLDLKKHLKTIHKVIDELNEDLVEKQTKKRKTKKKFTFYKPIKKKVYQISEQRMKSRLLKDRCFDLETNSYKCPENECINKYYQKYSSFYKHLKNIHKTRDFYCDFPECNKSFKSRDHLKLHTIIHKDFKPFECDFENCLFKCRSKSVLRTHRFKHTNDRPFKCLYDDCDKWFKSKKDLKSHSLIHSSDRPFVCDFDGCDRRFKLTSELNRHSWVHKSVPMFKCVEEGCGQSFQKEYWLYRHRVTVHNKAPYVKRANTYPCDWPGCDYRNTKAIMKVHKTKHTGERPYVCDWPECGKSFRLDTGLRDHRNIHYNLKPYVCHWPGCHYWCANSGNLIKHIKQVHKSKH